jgi:hypothetical protein
MKEFRALCRSLRKRLPRVPTANEMYILAATGERDRYNGTSPAALSMPEPFEMHHPSMRMDYNLQWPQLKGSPVLDSIRPVIEQSRDVKTNVETIRAVAKWMAYEDLPMPDYVLPLGIGEGNRDEVIDFILTTSCIDTAFTDFESHIKFQSEYGGHSWSDSDALFACMKRAVDKGISILDGAFLAAITRPQMETIFAGNIGLPMLEEKMQILHQVGAVLTRDYGGRFHNFVISCPPRLYDQGSGLLERLIKEFPRFNDISVYQSNTIKFYKLPQLAIWFLYTSLRRSAQFKLEDLTKMSAFADYIVPVALRLLGITSYSAELENRINTYQMIPHNSPQEIEIRAHCIYASALLADEINQLRPPDRQIIVPQLDGRLWTHYHTTWWPHHLTKTIMY